MAWYPGARKMELQPESDNQPAIRPTQFILHSIAAPWDENRIYEYWRDSTNLESHFGLDYDGSIGQFIGTETRADACYLANRRPDGTGAVSIETASNLQHTDPWTAAQIEELIELGVWLHRQHGIPLRVCRSWDDPGYGYHRLWPEWAVDGTACPGDARVKQFKEIIFPGIVARATGAEEPDLDATQAQQLKAVYNTLVPFMGWQYRGKGATRDTYATLNSSAADAAAASNKASQVLAKLDAMQRVTLTADDVTAIAAQVAGSDALAEKVAELVAAKLAARLAQ